MGPLRYEVSEPRKRRRLLHFDRYPHHVTDSPTTAPAARHALRQDAERNRQRILQAAASVFAEHGLGAPMDAVADRAGVGVGTVYRRFPDKEALVEALFEARIGRIIGIADEALAMTRAWAGLLHFLHEVAHLQAGDRGLREIALSTGYGRSRVAALRTRVARSVDRLVERAQAEGELRQGMTGNDIPLLLFMVGEVAQNSRGLRPDLASRYLGLLTDGMRARSDVTPLEQPMTDDELEAFMQGWGPAPR